MDPRNTSFLYFIQDSSRTYYQCIREPLLMYNLDINVPESFPKVHKRPNTKPDHASDQAEDT